MEKINSIPPETKPRIFYGYIVVAASLFIMIAFWGTRYTFGVFIDPMLDEFGWTRATISGAFSLSMALEGSLTTVVGVFTDRIGPRLVMSVCAVVLMLGFWLMSQVNELWQLYVVYGVIIGGAMSCAFVPIISNLTRWFIARRNFMTGIVCTGSGIGPLIGALVANALIASHDWRFALLIFGAGSFLIILSGAQFLRRDPAAVGQLPYGQKKDSGSTDLPGISLKQALRNRHFWLFFACFFCFGTMIFSIMVHIVPHALDLHASPAAAAGILSVIGAVAIAGRLIGGRMGDVIGSGRVILFGSVVMTAVMFFLAPAGEIWMLYLAAVFFGFVQASTGTVHSAYVAERFGLRSHGAIFGLLGTGYTAGAALGPLMTGFIFDITGEYQLAFIICGLFGTTSIVLLLILRTFRSTAARVWSA